jgi:hypothetical protein
MSGKYSRRKGYRFEHRIEALARERGVECRRVPLSGGAPGWAGDLWIAGRLFEAKSRGDGFRSLYRWLEDRDGLVIGADRKPPLVVLRLQDYLLLCGRSETHGRPLETHSGSNLVSLMESRNL